MTTPIDAANRIIRGDAADQLFGQALLDMLGHLPNLALFGHDREWRITNWNKGAERIFGYRSDEIIGSSVHDLVPEHVREDLQVVAGHVADGERVERVFTEIQRKDGMLVPIALSMAPVHDATGGFVGSVAVAQELTEIRLAQAALGEVEHRFQEWEALAHVGRWLWDVGTDAVQWSDELHRMHGVPPAEFTGTLAGHLAAIHTDDRKRVQSLMQRCVSSREPVHAQYRVSGDDHAATVLEVHAEAEIGSAGAVVGIRGISHDVSLNASRQ